MSMDFENITKEQLHDMPNSKRLEYAWHWQIMQEKGVQLEWLDGDEWKPLSGTTVYTFIVYRVKPQPTKKIVPLDFSDFLNINLRWIIDTRTNERCYIASYMSDYEKLHVKYISRYEYVGFEDLQKYFTRLDGSRFEKVANG